MARPRDSETTTRIIDAASRTLRERGYAGASARRIAATGDFNQALIFYHFGSVDDLFVAALERSSRERLARYEERFAEAKSLTDAIGAARELYREDVESGHVKVLAELVGAGSASPELGAKVAEHVHGWLAFSEQTLRRLIPPSALPGLPAPAEVAFGFVALYLGMEMLTNLTGDRGAVDALFDTAGRAASLWSAFLQPGASQ